MRSRRFLVLAVVLLALAAGGLAATAHGTPGSIVATITLGGTYPSEPIVDGRTGHAFVNTGAFGQSASSEVIRMLDLRSGRVVRTLPMPWTSGFDFGGIDERAGRLYVVVGLVPAATDIVLFDTTTGARVATTHLDDYGASLSVDAVAGRVYAVGYVSPSCTDNACTDYDGTVSTLDARTGRLLRTVHLAPVEPGLVTVAPRAQRVILESALNTGRLALSFYDLRTGRRLQQVPLPAGLSGYAFLDSLDDATGLLYLSLSGVGLRWTSSGSLGPPPRYALGVLDTRTGRLLVRPLPAALNAMTVALQPGAPYVALTAAGPTGPGQVELRDRRTLALLHDVAIAPGAFEAAIDGRRGRVYVLSRTLDPTTGLIGPGTVSVVDAASGRVVRTLAVGLDAASLTLDAPMGRLLILYDPSSLPLAVPDPWNWIPPQLRRRLPFITQAAPRPRRTPARLTIVDTGRL